MHINRRWPTPLLSRVALDIAEDTPLAGWMNPVPTPYLMPRGTRMWGHYPPFSMIHGETGVLRW